MARLPGWRQTPGAGNYGGFCRRKSKSNWNYIDKSIQMSSENDLIHTPGVIAPDRVEISFKLGNRDNHAD